MFETVIIKNCNGMTYHFISNRGDIIVTKVTPHYSSFPGCFKWVRRWLNIYGEECVLPLAWSPK